MLNKTNNKIIFNIIIICFSFASAFGQNNFRGGFIITLENDTIQGQVDYRSNSKNYESSIFLVNKAK